MTGPPFYEIVLTINRLRRSFFYARDFSKVVNPNCSNPKDLDRICHYGAAACRQPGTARALASKTRRSGSLPGELAVRGMRYAVNPCHQILSRSTPPHKPGGRHAPFRSEDFVVVYRARDVRGVNFGGQRSRRQARRSLARRVISRVPSSNLSFNCPGHHSKNSWFYGWPGFLFERQ